MMPRIPKKNKRRDAAVRHQPGLFDPPREFKYAKISGIAYIERTADGKTRWINHQKSKDNKNAH